MDYEKKYKEALEKARKLATDLPNGRNDRLYHIWDLENIFPELKKESENERIRKELINYFIKGKEYLSLCSFSKEEVLTWLEEQGKQKQKQYDIDVLEKHITKDSISELAHTVIVRNGWEIVDAKESQNYWSEEDEEFLKRAIKATKDLYPITSDWLKSLRPQNRWKPTDEQMNALSVAVKHGQTDDPDALKKLLEQLKKLKGG